MTPMTSRQTPRALLRNRPNEDQARRQAERERRKELLGGDGKATWPRLLAALGVKPKGGKVAECLTEGIVRAACTKPLGFQYALKDGVVAGLALRVGPDGGGVWWLQYRTRGGHPEQLKIGPEAKTSKDEARAAAMGVLAAVRDGENPAAERRAGRAEVKAKAAKLTLRGWVTGDYWSRYLKDMKDGGPLQRRILSVYSSVLDKPLEAITRDDIEGVLQARKDATVRRKDPATGEVRQEPMKPATVHRDWQALCAALNVAVDLGRLSAMPTSKLPQPLRNWKGEARIEYVGKRGPKERDRFLAALAKYEKKMVEDTSEDGVARLLVFAVRLAWATGMRRGEILSLRARDIGETHITLPGYRTKTRKARAVELNADAREALKLWKLRSAKGEFFPGYMDDRGFTGPAMDPEANSTTVTWRSRLYDAWKGLREEAGLPDLHLHDLRHTFATDLRKKGVALEVVRNALGHTDLKATQIYAHVTSDEVASAVNLLSIGKALQP